MLRRTRQDPEALRWLRERNLDTQETLAARAGLTQQYLSALEQGERSASARALAQLANALGCQVSMLERKHTEAAGRS